ncbi:map kinase kinase kinase [Lentinula edodes]|uniref:Map kinase kinase kinase n=1 Tax=Lentinula edodes TaxID=5353 RepID=A0A1Q3E175_LENED|nr:map kinase kinase kinase [Lentinula edodes]
MICTALHSSISSPSLTFAFWGQSIQKIACKNSILYKRRSRHDRIPFAKLDTNREQSSTVPLISTKTVYYCLFLLLAAFRESRSLSPTQQAPKNTLFEGLQFLCPCHYLMSRLLPTTRIIVSSNAEQYRVVEITGAPNGSFIRERILSKMCVPDNSFSRYSIYQSEIGAYALGGSLRFFVSTAPNRPPTRNEPEYPPDNNYHSSRYYRAH